MSSPGKIKTLDQIQGANYLKIAETLSVFEKQKPDFKASKFEVRNLKETAVVFLSHKAEKAENSEKIGVNPATKLKLSPDEFQAFKNGAQGVQTLDHVDCVNFFTIQKAVEVFQRHDVEIADYKIEVVSEGDSIVIIFTDKMQEPGVRGSVGKMGFEVELKAQDQKVVRSNFVR